MKFPKLTIDKLLRPNHHFRHIFEVCRFFILPFNQKNWRTDTSVVCLAFKKEYLPLGGFRWFEK
jgi:hypothetical protein